MGLSEEEKNLLALYQNVPIGFNSRDLDFFDKNWKKINQKLMEFNLI